MITGSALFGVFQAIGKAYIPLILMTCAVAVKAVLNPILMSVPMVNITGAAVSTAAGYMIIAVIGSVILSRQLSSEISVVRCVFKPFVSAVLCAGTARVVYCLTGSGLHKPFNVVLSVLAGALVYGISLILAGDFRKNRQLIKIGKKNS